MEDLLSRCPRWVAAGPAGRGAVRRVRGPGLHVPFRPAGPMVPAAGGLGRGCPLQPPPPGGGVRPGRGVRPGLVRRPWYRVRLRFWGRPGACGIRGPSPSRRRPEAPVRLPPPGGGEAGPRVKIYTAHHADDQAETVLLNLIRGTGTAGLAGMTYHQDGVVRPLLGRPAQRAGGLRRRRGLPHVEDDTNSDPDAAARNFLRLQVMPLLGELNPRAVEHINAPPPTSGQRTTPSSGRPPGAPPRWRPGRAG